jgi:putative Mn2+ efflux pump MntP
MEPLLTSAAIGVGLAMDCFAVAIAAGGNAKGKCMNAAIVLAAFFGVFQSGMTLAGWVLGSGFAAVISSFDHWIAAFLLFTIGGRMLIAGIRDGEGESPPDVMNLLPVTGLALATSIDAIAVGISFAFLNVAPFVPALVIGLVTAAFSCAGVFVGGKLGHLFGRRVDILGGVILVLIGFRVIFDHTAWI